jgi:hypothetical protein
VNDDDGVSGRFAEDFRLGLTPVFDVVAFDGSAGQAELRRATTNRVLLSLK